MTSWGGGGMDGYTHSAASKKKIGEASKGNKYAVGIPIVEVQPTRKQRKKNKRALQDAPRRGTPHSEETKQKMQETALQK